MGEIHCPLCKGDVEDGFVMDRGRYPMPAEWIQGAPVRSFWVGTDTSDAVHRQIEALRCSACGYVMLFATQKVPAS